jgi:cysteine desulfurase
MDVYLDNAATAVPKKHAIEEAMPWMTEEFYNPSGNYEGARKCRKKINECREIIAGLIGLEDPSGIIFTSGATESNNIAIQGIMKNLQFGRILTTPIEHHAITNQLSLFPEERKIILKTYRGVVDTHNLMLHLKYHICTDLVSVMAINNETGAISPLNKIGNLCKQNEAFFHCDATQAVGKIPINMKQNNIDCLSASAHKFGGIRGAGFLAVNKKIKGSISPLVYGGGHENNIRSGTEPTALIVAMTVALQDAVNNMIDRRDYLFGLKQYFINKLYAVSPNIYINNNMKNVYEGILNVYFGGARGEELLEFLSEQKIYASSGSACNSNTGEPSAVLRDLGLPKERVESSIRFSMDCNNTIEEIDYVVDVIRMFYKMHGLE